MKHCVCGRPSERQESGGICEHCRTIPLSQYVKEANERLGRVAKIPCPRCHDAKYTRLTQYGICIDCLEFLTKRKGEPKKPVPVAAQGEFPDPGKKHWWED